MPKEADLVKKTLSKIADKEALKELYDYLAGVEEERKRELLIKRKIEEEQKKTEMEHNRKLGYLSGYAEDPMDIIYQLDSLEELGFGDGDAEEITVAVEECKLKIKEVVDRVYHYLKSNEK